MCIELRTYFDFVSTSNVNGPLIEIKAKTIAETTHTLNPFTVIFSINHISNKPIISEIIVTNKITPGAKSLLCLSLPITTCILEPEWKAVY